MTTAIELLVAGERPTEPGWYVVNSARFPSECVYIGAADEEGRVLFVGTDERYLIERALKEYTFIARIYPDRIEGRK